MMNRIGSRGQYFGFGDLLFKNWGERRMTFVIVIKKVKMKDTPPSFFVIFHANNIKIYHLDNDLSFICKSIQSDNHEAGTTFEVAGVYS